MTTNSTTDAGDRPISPTFLILATTFCTCLIVANLLEIKTFSIGPLTLTAGLIVFPISYIISDCIVEIYGLRRARLVIWLGFAMNLFTCLILQLAIWIPGDPAWHHQAAMQTIFGTVPRIVIASFAAFLAGSMVNAYVMSRMKANRQGTVGFSARAITSTVLGEAVDSSIFFPLAFLGTFPLPIILSLIATQTILKTLYEIIVLPLTLRLVKKLRRIEGHDAASPL